MNYFLPESSGALEVFVRQHINDPHAAPTFVQLIQAYAGTDKAGEVLNAILLKWETGLRDQHFQDSTDYTGAVIPGYTQRALCRYAAGLGTIRGRSFRPVFRKPHSNDPAAAIFIECYIITLESRRENKYLTIAKTPLAEWSFETRRAALIKGLLIYYQNETCPYPRCLPAIWSGAPPLSRFKKMKFGDSD